MLVTGLYLYGSVGSGKSLLMDMFYNVIIEHDIVPNKRRMHFNAAMLEVNLPTLITACHEQRHLGDTPDTEFSQRARHHSSYCCLAIAFHIALQDTAVSLGLVSMILFCVTVKTVESIDPIEMPKTDCFGKTMSCTYLAHHELECV